MDRNEMRRLANELGMEYDGDPCELYAHVCNHSNSAVVSNPDENLIALKHEIEHRITLEVMEEHSWEQNEMGYWRKVSDGEFWKRYRAAMDRTVAAAPAIDPTGVILNPGDPENCAGVDECCDECDYYLKCFPE